VPVVQLLVEVPFAFVPNGVAMMADIDSAVDGPGCLEFTEFGIWPQVHGRSRLDRAAGLTALPAPAPGLSQSGIDVARLWPVAPAHELQGEFDRRLKLKFLGSKVTTDAGLLAYRELDEALSLSEMGEEMLTDSRLGSNKQHQLVPLLRQSVFSRLAGCEDINDAERLAHDPAMRHVVGRRAALADKYAASSSEVGRFETEILSTKDILRRLRDLSGQMHRQGPLAKAAEGSDSRHGQFRQ
jgi:hypothetical protein